MEINLGNKASRFFLNLIINGPYFVLAVIFVIAIASLSQIVDLATGKPKLELDPSVDSILPSRDPDRDFFENIKTLFDEGEVILLALSDQDIFTTNNLEKIQTLSEQLENLDQVNRVSSLSTALNIRSEDGQLLIDPFYDQPPTTQYALNDLKQRALNDPIYAGNLISMDSRVTLIMIYLLDIPEKDLVAEKVNQKIRAIADQYWSHGEIWMTGGAHIKAEMSYMMLRDVSTIIPLAMLVMAIIACISFKTLRGVMLPVLTMSLSVLVTLAFIAIAYSTLNQVSITVPSLLVVIGFAYAVHILSNYYSVLRAQNSKNLPEKPELIAQVLQNVTAPVIYTGITTSAGFFSLTTSSLSAIKQFGISAGLGVLITMLISLTLIPACLRLLPMPRAIPDKQKNNWLDIMLEKLAFFDKKFNKEVLFTGLFVSVLSIAAIPHIKISTDLVSSFQESSPVRQDFYSVNKHLQGANTFYIVLTTSVDEGFLEPKNLKVIEELQAWLHKQEQIGGSTSITDYVKTLNKGFHGDNQYQIPGSKGLVSELFLIGNNDELEQVVDFDYQTARIVIRTSAMDSQDVMALSEKIERYLNEHIPPHLKAKITGNSYLIAKTMNDIAIGQAVSIATAFIIIYIILVILFTSFKTGFIALIPNMIPVLLYFGILGWSGISLNVTTGLVACIVLGIAVDDTIHLMAHFNRSAKQSADESQGIFHALKTVGRPVTYTTTALCLGFLCLLISDMRTQVEFGLLACVTLLGAWVVDVTFTPAIAGHMKIVSLWDVISLDLGKNPHKSIPLFKGLTPTQARITALMANIVEYSQGEQIFLIGDVGNYMYVVIDGGISITLDNPDGTIFIDNLSRGDIIGEVALYHGERTANAYANSDVRLLEITKDDLEDIQRRHPKIAAQLYANLNEVFASRVADLTHRIKA